MKLTLFFVLLTAALVGAHWAAQQPAPCVQGCEDAALKDALDIVGPTSGKLTHKLPGVSNNFLPGGVQTTSSLCTAGTVLMGQTNDPNEKMKCGPRFVDLYGTTVQSCTYDRGQ